MLLRLKNENEIEPSQIELCVWQQWETYTYIISFNNFSESENKPNFAASNYCRVF